MKVNIYASHELQEEFKKLLPLGWLGEYDGWYFESDAAIADCAVRGAYSTIKVFNHFHDNLKRIILIEGNLPNFIPYRADPNSQKFIFSIKGYKHEDILHLIRAIEIIYLEETRCPTHFCLFSSSFLSKSTEICEECQTRLVSAGMVNNAVRLLTIASLEKRGANSTKYSHLHIGNAVRDLGITACHPAITVGATNMLIDAMAFPGSSVRDWLHTTAEKIQAEKENIKNRYVSSWPKSSITSPIFIASRRWNSWTPNQPVHEDSRVLHFKTGGGYFLSDGNTSIAIDPGYGYLDMLFEHGFTVMDIDSVVITHDHPDHLAEFQNILGLRHNYRKDCKELDLYLNPSSCFLLNNFAKYYAHLLKDAMAKPLLPETELRIGTIKLETIGMYHDEIYDSLGTLRNEVAEAFGPSKALGLKFTIEYDGGHKFTCVIPGDTSFPKEPDDCKKLLKFYGCPDVAAIHLGSIEEAWVNEISPASSIEYGENKHLGINGVIHFLRMLEPRVAVLTEFGEELDANLMRLSVVELIKQSLTSIPTKVLPSDLTLFLAFYNGETFCKCECDNFIPANLVEYHYREGSIKYEFCAGCDSGLHHTLSKILFPHKPSKKEA